jgi:hypothetical protein
MLRHDLRFALRLHTRRPLLAGLIILTLGLAIGATMAIFSVAYPVVLKPLAVREPDRLVQIFEAYPKGSRYVWGITQSFISVRPGTFNDWMTQSESFDTIAASMWQMVVVGGGAGAESVDAQTVTERFFETLGVAPLLGRTLSADDTGAGAARVGRHLRPLDGRLSRSLRQHVRHRRADERLRLRPLRALVLPAARRRRARAADRVRQYRESADRTRDGTDVRVWSAQRLGRATRAARAPVARRERAAGGNGAVVGVLVAWTALPAVLRLLPPASRVPRLDDVRIDAAVLLFAAAVTVVTTLIVGVMPAWRSARVDVIDTLKDAARGSSMSARSARTGQLLVIAEVALTFVLLVGAALLAQSLRTLLRVDPGGETSKVLAMSLILPPHAYGAFDLGGPNPTRVRLFADLEREMHNLPGASSAAMTMSLPLRHGPNPWAMHIEGRAAPPPNASAYGGATRVKKTGLHNHGDVSIQRVTPDYFETFAIPLLRGRLFDDHDAADRPAVAVINATAARRYFAAEDPIGKTIVIDMTSYFPRLTIVGVVGDSRMNGLDRKLIPQVFWPMAQRPSANAWLAIRTTGDPATIASSARALLHRLAPEIAIDQTATMGTVLAAAFVLVIALLASAMPSIRAARVDPLVALRQS